MNKSAQNRRAAVPGRFAGAVAVAMIGAMVVTLGVVPTASADVEDQRAIELDVIEIESEVPRRVAQFFVQRDRLQYQEMDEKPSFMPELMESVDKDPF